MNGLLNFFHGDVLVNFTESINTFIKNNLVGSGGGAGSGGTIILESATINILHDDNSVIEANGGNGKWGGGAGGGGFISFRQLTDLQEDLKTNPPISSKDGIFVSSLECSTVDNTNTFTITTICFNNTIIIK